MSALSCNNLALNERPLIRYSFNIVFAHCRNLVACLLFTRVPHILNSSLDITIEGTQYDEIAIRISPNADVYRYIFMILDETTYQYMLELLDYREEYLQWAVTSYLAYVKLGSIVVEADRGYTSAKAVEIKLSDAFGAVPSDKTFHVLVTGMSGEIDSPQCFCHKTFSL